MIKQSLTLPGGHQVANCICKAAMTEGLATSKGYANDSHQPLYSRWAHCGVAVLLTGNIAVDGRYLERAGNVVLEDSSGIDALRACKGYWGPYSSSNTMRTLNNQSQKYAR